MSFTRVGEQSRLAMMALDCGRALEFPKYEQHTGKNDKLLRSHAAIAERPLPEQAQGAAGEEMALE